MKNCSILLICAFLGSESDRILWPLQNPGRSFVFSIVSQCRQRRSCTKGKFD